MRKSPLHTFIVNALFNHLEHHLPMDYWLRKEDPLTLADSEPEPDISIVKGHLAEFKHAHPDTADWVIEVAVTSLAIDRAKAAIYAAAQIPCYWLINVEAAQIEVYTQPQAGQYQSQQSYQDTITTPFGTQLSVPILLGQQPTM